jgi:GNAT superfamily N-acetyltransferase
VTTVLAIREMTEADEADVLTLLTTTMAGGPTGERTAEFFRWKHRHNYFGPSIAYVAEQDGELVGLRTFMRWRFLRDDRRVEAVRAVDTATHPHHQGRGIFTSLTKAALRAAQQEAALVFNTPNSNSLPGYLKMGWLAVGTVPIAIRVARPVRFLRGARGALTGGTSAGPVDIRLPPVRAALEDTQAVQDLLDEASKPSGLRTDRTADYFQWRYAEAPGLDYRAVTTAQGGRLSGIAIGRPRRRGSLVEMTLTEVIVRSGDRSTAARLLRKVASAGADHVATHLRAWPDAESARRWVGAVNAPGTGMTLVANMLHSEEPAVTSLDSWSLSLGDLEVF